MTTTTTTYELLSWGANSHDQLGHGIKSEQCMIPMAVNLKLESNDNPRLCEIRKVIGGAGHSLILTMKGEVYSCGLNNKGQAGKPRTRKNLSIFERIVEIEDEVIVDIAAGWDSSMAINKEGNLYAWGSNAYGQLGLKINVQSECKDAYLYAPEKIHLDDVIGRDDTVVKIAMGLRHSVLLTRNGKVLVSGNGNKCQLGIIDSTNTPIRNTMKFTQVPQLFGIKAVACGQHHTMALTKQGDLFGWGDNKHGQLGFDVRKHPSVETPLKLENLNVGSNAEIFTGWTHTAVLYDGKVLAWGRNTYGQLGRVEEESLNRSDNNWLPKLVKNIPKHVNQLAIGSEHNIALTEDGSITCWGWNEHGNCGTGTDEDIRIPEVIKVPKNGKGKLVGTGYGHSFALVEQIDQTNL